MSGYRGHIHYTNEEPGTYDYSFDVRKLKKMDFQVIITPGSNLSLNEINFTESGEVSIDCSTLTHIKMRFVVPEGVIGDCDIYYIEYDN